MSNILIAANNICKVYDQDILLKRGANFYALQNIDFNLYEGDFISVMGPSGSGKSTLLNCLSTLDNVTSGVLKVLGKEVSQMSDNELSLYRNKYLGFIFQNHNLVSSLSIFDNIATPLILNEEAPDQIIDKVNEIAKKLSLRDWQVTKIMKNASNFHIDDLKDYIISFAHMDYKIKSGSWDKVMGLYTFLINYFA